MQGVQAAHLDGREGCCMCLKCLAALLVYRVQLHEALYQSRPAGQDTTAASALGTSPDAGLRERCAASGVSSRLAGPAHPATGSCMEQPAAAHGSFPHWVELLAFLACNKAPAILMQLGLGTQPCSNLSHAACAGSQLFVRAPSNIMCISPALSGHAPPLRQCGRTSPGRQAQCPQGHTISQRCLPCS